jgi:hypothetical protein
LNFKISSTIRIIDVWGRGVANQERVAIAVDRRCNLGKYVLLQGVRGANGGVVTMTPATAFWFPDREVEAHSIVFVYTDTGTFTETFISNDGLPSLQQLRIPALVYHWGSKETLFHHPLLVPVIIRASRISLPPGE